MATNLSELNVDDVVECKYWGHGEHPGNKRTIRVLEVQPGGILGEDLTFPNETHKKRFKDDQAAEIVIKKKADLVEKYTFVEAREALMSTDVLPEEAANELSGETLAKILAKHVYGPTFDYEWDAESGVITLTKKLDDEELGTGSNWGDKYVSVDLYSSNGLCNLTIFDDEGETVVYLSLPNKPERRLTAKQVGRLVEVLSEYEDEG